MSTAFKSITSACTIEIDSRHIIETMEGGKNCKFHFEFPMGQQMTTDSKGMSTISTKMCLVPFSWFNVTDVYGNNTFSYLWPTVGNLGSYTEFKLHLPNGYYTLTDMNNFLESSFLENGHYLVDENGFNVFYLLLEVNVVRYRIQLTSFKIPSVLPLGWSNPTLVELSGVKPKLFIPANAGSRKSLFRYFGIDLLRNVYSIVGSVDGVLLPSVDEFQASVGIDSTSILMDSAAVENEITSVVLCAPNLVNNVTRIPSTVLNSVIVDKQFGDDLTSVGISPSTLPLRVGSFSSIDLEIRDQDGFLVSIEDPDIHFELYITNVYF